MRNFKYTSLMAFLVFGLMLTACSKEENNEGPGDPDPQFNDVALSAEMDLIFASLETYIVDVYESEKANPLLREAKSKVVDCASVSAIINESSGTITINFEAAGCVIKGHKYEGEIVITYEYDSVLDQTTIVYQLNEYYFDDKNISGNSTIIDLYSNVRNNPQRTHIIDLTVTWPNNLVASRNGEIVAEWIEGYETAIIEDNVFEVSGSWDDTFANTYTNSYDITEVLIRKGNCDYVVSGSIDIEHIRGSAVINFGDGNCDSTAILTFNGMEYTIEVEK